MLQLILHITIISVQCMLWGLPTLLFLKKSNPENDSSFWIRSTAGLYCFLYFSGLIVLSFITSFACLFVPLKFSYFLILTLGLLLFLIPNRKKMGLVLKQYSFKWKFNIIEYAIIFICILMFILIGSLKPVNADTNIYHVQIIKWFNEYGTVPGIANLFPRYGLGSNWFNLISIFKIPFFTNNNYTWLNATTVIWFFVWLFNNWKFHQNNASLSIPSKVLSHLYLLLIFFGLFEWELFRDAANSANYDFIVTALTIAIVLFLIEEILLPPNRRKFSFIFAIVCLSLIPLKLSGVFAILLLLYYLLSFKKAKYWIYCFIAGILITIPFLIKNYIITGYPLFPVSLSFSSPDWQVPVAMTDYLRQYIHVTNRFYNIPIDYKQIPELMHKSWISLWFSGILIQQKLIILGAITSLFVIVFKPSFLPDIKKLKILFLLLFLMAVGWFFSAPSPRFGYGVLLILSFFPACLFFGRYISTRLHQPVFLIAIAISCFYIYKKSSPIRSKPAYLVYPVALDKPPGKKINLDSIEFYLPEIINNGWMRDCYDSEVPCIYQENIYLQPRGKSIKDGFKITPQPDSNFVRKYIY